MQRVFFSRKKLAEGEFSALFGANWAVILSRKEGLGVGSHL
jgi:hypothetical protein